MLDHVADAALSARQHTLAQGFQRSGVGLHSGQVTQVQVFPAATGAGRYFVRIDLPDAPEIAAHIDQVHSTLLSTELSHRAATVRTVEHLLAALSAMGVDNARIEINGSEVPLLDGSALGWVEAILQAGVVPQAAERQSWQLTQPVWVQEGDAFVAALPAAELRFTYGIDFAMAAIGNQWFSWSPYSASTIRSKADSGSEDSSFATAVAPARTFGLANQIEHLQQSGLIKGGNLENALVCSESGWLNPPLRFSNEPVRHKLLDLVGDLSLLGRFPSAHILAYKASHRLHTRLAQQLAPVLLPA